MRATVYILIALVSLTGLQFAEAQSIPANYTDVNIPDMKWDPPKYSEFKLWNGIAGLVVEDHEVPLVNFNISFPSPSDPEDKVGLADMTAWVLRNGGSTNIPPDSLNDIIEFKAAYLWIYAGQELVRVSGYCLAEDLELMMSFAKELIDNPAYPEDKIELQRGTKLEYIRRQNDRPRGIARREMSRLLYQDHPWGWNSSEESINSITRDDMLKYHSQVFQPKGAVFGISGDVTHKKAKKLAKKYFGKIKKSNREVPPLPSKVTSADPGIYYVEKEATQAYVSVGHLTVDYNDPRRHATEIMNDILGGGGFQARLMKRIRVEEGLAYGVYSRFTTPVPVVGRFVASASTGIDKSGRTLSLMNEVIADYAENGPTKEEFDKSKQAFINSFVWKFESADDLLSQLVYYKWRGLPLDTPQLDLAAYQKLTLEDVTKAAQSLLHPDKFVMVVVGLKAKMDRPLEDFGTVHTIELDK